MDSITKYEAPQVTVVGTLGEVTEGQATGTKLDRTFPTGTPFGDLTFS